jgi:hypothetical protein
MTGHAVPQMEVRLTPKLRQLAERLTVSGAHDNVALLRKTATKEELMVRGKRLLAAAVVVCAAIALMIPVAFGADGGRHASASKAAVARKGKGIKRARVKLTPSTPQLAACMPRAKVNVEVHLVTDQTGRDKFEFRARGLPPRRDFTIFLLQFAGPPFGAAEYIGDFHSDKRGRANQVLWLIVQEAFSSTIVNGTRVRVDLNQIGAWFADPKEDDFCLGPTSPTTPFDGDNSAGVQAFNSAQSTPLPAP